jgi:chemotaxis protein CheC
MEERLTGNQLDVIREMGTIGAANAATALSGLISEKVEINVPEVNIVPLEAISTLLGETDKLFFVLDMEINVDIFGRIFMLFSPNDAAFIAGTLLGQPKEQLDYKDDMFQSSLKECANILGSSYVNALAAMTNMTISISIPSLAEYSEEALIIKTDLKVKGSKLEGLFLLFLTSESLKKTFNILGVS